MACGIKEVPTLYRKRNNSVSIFNESIRVGGTMKLQDEVKYYLSRFGMSKSHMANALDISLQQLSAWTREKLVLPDYHMEKIRKFIDTVKMVDEFLQQNNLVM